MNKIELWYIFIFLMSLLLVLLTISYADEIDGAVERRIGKESEVMSFEDKPFERGLPSVI